jgi:hypothetical protein
MSSALQPAAESLETPDQVESSLHHAEYIDNASKYDGSRTPPQKIALVHALKRDGRSVNAICQILSMSPLTVKAIIARGEDLITDARMLLKANALGFAADAIQASRVAAEKGKIEGISAMLDRLDVTQPPKGQQGSQVAVQINLHGGPEPVSLAKVQVQSESLENQAGKSEGLIMQLMDTVAHPPQVPITQALSADPSTVGLPAQPRSRASEYAPIADAKDLAEVGKQA